MTTKSDAAGIESFGLDGHLKSGPAILGVAISLFAFSGGGSV